jgi:cobalamin biosynthesis protein CbiG
VTGSCAIYVLVKQGIALAISLAENLSADLYAPGRLAEGTPIRGFDSLPNLVAQTFHAYDNHIFIAAAGIAVRTIAPHLQGKTQDPAVIVLDHKGTHVISLLSGHLGGANKLARQVADLTGGTPVITTATDTEGVPAMDMLAAKQGLVIANPQRIKVINAALAEGRPVELDDPEYRLDSAQHTDIANCFIPVSDKTFHAKNTPLVRITWRMIDDDQALILHPKVLIAGIGCRKGTTREEIMTAITGVFDEHHLALDSLASLVSIDIKAKEAGMLEAASALHIPLTFYSADELRGISIPTPSSMVKKHIGVESVCEAAALKKTGQTNLLVPKQIRGRTTLAIAVAP